MSVGEPRAATRGRRGRETRSRPAAGVSARGREPACRSRGRSPGRESAPPGGQRRGRARPPAEVWAAAAVIAAGLLSSLKAQDGWFKQQNNPPEPRPVDFEGGW